MAELARSLCHSLVTCIVCHVSSINSWSGSISTVHVIVIIIVVMNIHDTQQTSPTSSASIQHNHPLWINTLSTDGGHDIASKDNKSSQGVCGAL